MRPLPRLAFPTLLCLSGCGLGLDPVTPGGSDETVRIDLIQPDWGPTRGGNQVAIQGEGFVGAVTVSFGAALVAPTVFDDQNLVVTAPAANMTIQVDVIVESDLGTAVAAGGYTFSDTEPSDDSGDTDDTGDTDDPDDTGGEPSGTGGLVELYYDVIACPECFGVSSQISLYADAVFHAPRDGHWWDWMPEVGTCRTDPSNNGLASSFYNAGDRLTLSSGSASISMTRQPDDSYVASNVTQSDFVSQGLYRLAASGGAELGAVDVSGALRAPLANFTSLQPEGILETGTLAFAPVVSRSGTTFTWAPTSPDDHFVVVIAAYDASGSTQLGTTWCLGRDNGSLSIPAANLSWPAGSLLAVYVERYVFNNFTIPASDAYGDAIAACGFLGTATLR
jgi:hypothetical protein